MKKYYKYLGGLLLMFILFNQSAFSQCTQSLNIAEDEFEKGRLLDIPSMLSLCLRGNNFSKEEKIRAYKLLTKVYIFSDKEKEAEESLIKLLRADPEHKLDNLFDPAEIFYLYEKFRVNPIFRIALKAGVNSSRVNAFDDFTAFTNSDQREYSSENGVSFEMTIERHIEQGLEVAAGIQFHSTRFSLLETFSNTPVVINIKEAQTWINVPLLLRYNYRYESKPSIMPYVYGGVAFNYLLTAQFSNSERQGGTQKTVNGYNLLTNNERTKTNFSLFAGGGIKIRNNRVNFFTIEAKYEVGLLNYVNSENRFVNNESISGLAYVPDNLSLNFLSVSFGYTHSIYNPRKKSKYLKK